MASEIVTRRKSTAPLNSAAGERTNGTSRAKICRRQARLRLSQWFVLFRGRERALPSQTLMMLIMVFSQI